VRVPRRAWTGVSLAARGIKKKGAEKTRGLEQEPVVLARAQALSVVNASLSLRKELSPAFTNTKQTATQANTKQTQQHKQTQSKRKANAANVWWNKQEPT
jgi:hypothetical protein